MLVCALSFVHMRTRPRVQCAPDLPCALGISRGRNEEQASDKWCRESAKLRVDVATAATHSSSWRKPGPITPNVNCCVSCGHNPDHNQARWLWVLAFARTTMGRVQRTRPLFLSPA